MGTVSQNYGRSQNVHNASEFPFGASLWHCPGKLIMRRQQKPISHNLLAKLSDFSNIFRVQWKTRLEFTFEKY